MGLLHCSEGVGALETYSWKLKDIPETKLILSECILTVLKRGPKSLADAIISSALAVLTGASSVGNHMGNAIFTHICRMPMEATMASSMLRMQ